MVFRMVRFADGREMPRNWRWLMTPTLGLIAMVLCLMMPQTLNMTIAAEL